MKYFTILFLFFVSCESLPFWQADNPLEEAIEEVIYDNTGYDIDLTPSSPEARKGAKVYHMDINY